MTYRLKKPVTCPSPPPHIQGWDKDQKRHSLSKSGRGRKHFVVSDPQLSIRCQFLIRIQSCSTGMVPWDLTLHAIGYSEAKDHPSSRGRGNQEKTWIWGVWLIRASLEDNYNSDAKPLSYHPQRYVYCYFKKSDPWRIQVNIWQNEYNVVK